MAAQGNYSFLMFFSVKKVLVYISFQYIQILNEIDFTILGFGQTFKTMVKNRKPKLVSK